MMALNDMYRPELKSSCNLWYSKDIIFRCVDDALIMVEPKVEVKSGSSLQRQWRECPGPSLGCYCLEYVTITC